MAYAAITIEAGLFPADLLDRIATGEGPGQRPADFGADAATISAGMQAAFADLRALWQIFERQRQTRKDSPTSITRNQWVVPMLGVLGFGDLDYQPAALPAGDEAFVISHTAGNDPAAPPVHIVAFEESLDLRGKNRRSPHGAVQEYLNRSDALWGVVTNGRVIRVLRDSSRLTKLAYLEFDLGAILHENRYAEFVLLYRLLHRTRFPQGAADGAACPLEALYQAGVDAGGRVREGLRDGVETALADLGQAFLAHPASAQLRADVASGALDAPAYYAELLRLVYRLLFLLVAEDRKLLAAPGVDPAGPAVYTRFYSVAALRQRAERPLPPGDHADLWQGLIETFRLFRDEERAAVLGLAALGGDLFSVGALPHLEEAHCANGRLLLAIRGLTTYRERSDAPRRRVNFAALDVEELGSVYESLLDLHPVLTPEGSGWSFGFVRGEERKKTGSYYTPAALVHELVESALVPVIDARLAAAGPDRDARERALLGITVCDPAAGSGHFLLAAARRLARALATAREREPSPAPEAYRKALRDVVRSCIYAVDLNPLAVDLCKVALWIEGHDGGAPLTFIDHHVRCGNALVGVWDLHVLESGIPDAAYDALTGDDKKRATAAKKLNRELRQKTMDDGRSARQATLDEIHEIVEVPPSIIKKFRDLSAGRDASVAETAEKQRRFVALQADPIMGRLRTAADLWTYAYFAPQRPGDPRPPHSHDVRLALAGMPLPHAELGTGPTTRPAELRLFHWKLEFPEVFVESRGGFDCILGNPPWERVKLQEQEFFAARDGDIARAANAAARKGMIKTLGARNPELLAAFDEARRDAEATSGFLRGSERFPLAGRGDVNTYSVFAELATTLIAASGRCGVIVPTGIATDDTNKNFFRALVETGRLASLFDFENRAGLFPAVDSRMKFALLTVGGAGAAQDGFEAAFFLTATEALRLPETRFRLTRADIALLNPNTGTCPIFRTARDAELTKRLYRAAPVLVREGPPEENPWGVTFKSMFHMSNDSHLFRTRAELEALGARLDGNHFVHADQRWLPLYEGKLIHQYDHRLATYVGDDTADATAAQHEDHNFRPIPRYWIESAEVDSAGASDRSWFLGFRDITNATNERTIITTFFPRSAVSNKLPLLTTKQSTRHLCALLGNLCCVPFDFAARQKIGGTSLNFFIAKQLPVLAPEVYSEAVLGRIVPRVLELVYTAHDMAPFARDLGYEGPPFVWDDERRARLKAELDGIYAHLYGLGRDDFAYILDQFPVLKKNEERDHGFFRTRVYALQAWDYFSPAALTALFARIGRVERGVRDLLVGRLRDDVTALPAEFAWAVERAAGRGGRPTLRATLAHLNFIDLYTILAHPPTWERLTDLFESRNKTQPYFRRINELRNDLAHHRDPSDDTRRKGEEALTWLAARLGLEE